MKNIHLHLLPLNRYAQAHALLSNKYYSFLVTFSVDLLIIVILNCHGANFNIAAAKALKFSYVSAEP